MASSRSLSPGRDDDELSQQIQLPADDASLSRPADPVNIDDFDDDFDDDFEAEVAGEYEMEDDEFARQLVEMVDFDIEGLSDPDDAPDTAAPAAENDQP